MTELTKDNSYPCPGCDAPKLKDEWLFCPACLVKERAKIGGVELKQCPHCSIFNDCHRRRCIGCNRKLRPPGRTRDLTATQERVGAKPEPPIEEGLHPLVLGMLKFLPPHHGSMDLEQRLYWLRTMEANLSMAYGEDGEQARIGVELVWKRVSFRSRILAGLCRFEWFANRIRA